MADDEFTANNNSCQGKWLQWRKNMPQERALLAGFILMISSGLLMAWSLFNSEFEKQKWYEESTIIEILAVHLAWFVGSIVGGFNAGYFIDSMGRRPVLRIAIAAQIISSIILIFAIRSMIGIIFGRLIGGYSFGCAYITLLVYAAEISTKYNRGKLTAFIHLGQVVGILIFTIIIPFTVDNDELGIITTTGVVCGVLALISLAISHFYTYESPLVLITKDLDMDAQECFVKFRSEKYITLDIREDFHSYKDMVERDARHKGTIYKIPTFYFMLLMKICAVASFNYPLNMVRLDLVKSSIQTFNGFHLQSFILAILRFFISLCVVFVIDVTGRRVLMVCSSRLSAISLFALAIAYVSTGYRIAGVFNFCFEIVSSFGILMAVDVYSGEAFTTHKKGIGLSLIHCFENVLQMCLVVLGVLVGVNYVLGTTILFVCAAILLACGFIRFPETRKMSLVEATKRFLVVASRCHLVDPDTRERYVIHLPKYYNRFLSCLPTHTLC